MSNVTLGEINVPFRIIIRTPEGSVINTTSFTANVSGTHTVTVIPVMEGYYTIPGTATFIVGNQSLLHVNAHITSTGVGVTVLNEYNVSIPLARLLSMG